MDNVKKSHLTPMLMLVALMWENHHPLEIADRVNTTYRFYGVFRWGERHVYNARQEIARLDRDALEGR